MSRSAWKKPWTPLAQAARLVKTGPRMPRLIDTWLEAIFGAKIGTVSGLTRREPLCTLTISSAAISPMPPPPVFITTAISSRLESSIVNSSEPRGKAKKVGKREGAVGEEDQGVQADSRCRSVAFVEVKWSFDGAGRAEEQSTHGEHEADEDTAPYADATPSNPRSFRPVQEQYLDA